MKLNVAIRIQRRSLYRLALSSCAMLALAGCNWTALVDVSSSGEPGDVSENYGNAYADSVVSATGRYVAFPSRSSNLVSGDTNSSLDIFVRDTVTGATTRVSVDSAGNEADSDSLHPSISHDGRYIAFESQAKNLGGPGPTYQYIYVHDMVTGTTTLVARGLRPSISGDGRYIAFDASSQFPTPNHVYVRDMVNGTTTLASRNSSGTPGNSGSVMGSLSGDGRYLAFRSTANNLVTGDTNGIDDIFVRDLTTGVTTRVSVDSNGNQTTGNGVDGISNFPYISSDGNSVVFHSFASNLVDGDVYNTQDIFVHNMTTGTTTRVSVDSDGVPGNGASYSSLTPMISGDGRYVVFYSVASNLSVEGPGPNGIFLHDMITARTTLVSKGPSGEMADNYSVKPSISADGRYVSFWTRASNLVQSGVDSYEHIVIRAVPEVTVTAIVPDELPLGFTTPVTISGTNFLSGATPYLAGATLGDIVIVDENTITAEVTVPANHATGVADVLVGLTGGPNSPPGPAGQCVDCVTFVTPPGC